MAQLPVTVIDVLDGHVVLDLECLDASTSTPMCRSCRSAGRSSVSCPAWIAVGTALAGGPPRRSQRALLTHWAPASGGGVEAHVGEGMS
ncbi:MAG: hypothetical protein LC776_06740, partial [Acidobacteria bacterium]|nr:hypothetical protein [Acidobacteriota bacterium]